ncbi:MAG: hypothetical protein K9M57_02355 [Phycisphaerae bacterium]|nr:hypothetical protein [Phycisphaerae bacterium]
MIKKKSIAITAALVIGIIVSVSYFIRQVRISITCAQLINIGFYVKDHIEKYSGCFPASESDLEKYSGLNKIVSDSEIEYFFLKDPNDTDSKHFLYGFDSFKLRYGASLKNIKQVDRQLFDKFTLEKVVLIDGPYRKQLKDRYREISYAWYQSMVKASKQRE